MKIAVLTSSRADYGIYQPLLRRLKTVDSIELSIIAFGSHCSEKFGNTVNQIEQDGFEVLHKISNLVDGDAPIDIANSYARTVSLFAEFWANHLGFDWVLCLGDRFEMAAAVNAGIPFGVNFAHIHAGETTLGAIDNIYRHQISLASKLHFVATESYAERIHALIGETGTTELVGSLSLENIQTIPFLSKQEFNEKWNIDLEIPTILMTIHPETVDYAQNSEFIEELKLTIPELLVDHQLVVTLPNADTFGSLFRAFFHETKQLYPEKVCLIENFGTQSYFTCMKYADLLIGNTSSGIIEAATFGKFVINLGNRQGGRACSENVVTVPFKHLAILEEFTKLKGKIYTGSNCYYQKDSANKVLERLKKERQ